MFFSKKLFFIFWLLMGIILPLSKLAAQDSLEPFIQGDTTTIIAGIIKFILGLVGVVALIFMIYGGVTWMTSSGNAEQVKKGKGALIWATLGLVVCFLAYSLVAFVITKTINLGSATPGGGGSTGGGTTLPCAQKFSGYSCCEEPLCAGGTIVQDSCGGGKVCCVCEPM